MRKKISLLLLLSIFNVQIFAANSTCGLGFGTNEGSKTFFKPRAMIEDVAFFLALNNYNQYRKHYGPFTNNADDQRINIGKGIVFQKTRKCQQRAAEYFLPNNKQVITIAETGPADVDSLWLTVMAPVGESYSSTLTLNPERSMIGGYLTYHQDFERFAGTWFEANFAAYSVKHNLNPVEKLTDGGVKGTVPGAATALQYLGGNQLNYGKISSCNLENSGMDDIELKFGYNYYNCAGTGHLGLYVQTLIPIAEKPNARFLFEPLIGRAHWGLGAGTNLASKFIERENTSLVWMGDVSWYYLFKSKEKRSFDLNNGNWSRFMRGVTTTDTTFPLINSLTQTVDVTPRNVVNFWTALHFQRCNWHLEAGYNLWYRQCEKISLNANGCSAPCAVNLVNTANAAPFGTFGILNLNNVCIPITASNATINQPRTSVVSNATFVPIQLTDINLSSAAHPRVLTNKFYGSVAYDFTIHQRPLNVGLSASYEFTNNKNALEEWAVWGNFGVEF
ncbi:MAG: hypothetical protein P4L22_06750 [Candidatus Babeliales bacterium]|nr:hypothetical protein [Candidatus Babeliales bacterium]